ncbi:MAG: DUF1232 domain-containing protein [Polyangiaceae bacterium]|nr:DUF1232 domain-containing protein [Polyangiaceae bacterium]
MAGGDLKRTPWRFLLDNRASPFAKFFMLFAVIYVISPVDLVPDIALVIGWLDDLAVAATACTSLLLAMRRYTRGKPAPRAIETSGVEVG